MKQKRFPIPGIRIPAEHIKEFDKRTKTICLRVDESLYVSLCNLSGRWCMKLSHYCMRVMREHVEAQQLLCNQGKRRLA